eukprot:5689627-Alexandrium_andersonii.AAC.1
MGTPPEVMRSAIAQLGVGRALPRSFTCVFLRRSLFRNLLASLPGAMDPESPLLAFALARAASTWETVINGLGPHGPTRGDAVEARAVLARLRSVLEAPTGLELLSPL